MASGVIRAAWFEWITAAQGAPAQVGVITVTDVATGVKLDWAHNTEPDLDHYVVRRSPQGAATWTALDTRVRVSEFIDTDVDEVTAYDYSVAAVDVAGNEGTVRTALDHTWTDPNA